MVLCFRSLGIVRRDIVVVCACYVVLLVSSVWPFSTWVVPVFLLGYCVITLRICCLLLGFVLWRLVCGVRASWPRIPFQCSVLFGSARCFFVKGKSILLLGDHAPLFMEVHYCVTLKVPWWPPYGRIYGCFWVRDFAIFVWSVGFCLGRCWGAWWAATCTFQYRPWTGSIKPSL
jgi:hypothetical protein